MMSLMGIQRLLSVGLVTLILLIQVLHYPSFKFFEESTFPQAMNFHQNRITWIVLPLMMSELIISIWMMIISPGVINCSILGLVILIWASTFFLQVPLHNRLLQKKDLLVIDTLTKSNLIRTCLWSTKLVLTFVGVT